MKIGIDFGTTFSLPAAMINGHPATLLPGGAYGMPSVFYRDAKQGILIGDPADKRGNFKPENVVRNIKMVISDTATKNFRLDGRNFTKNQIVGKIIEEIVKIAQETKNYNLMPIFSIVGAVVSNVTIK